MSESSNKKIHAPKPGPTPPPVSTEVLDPRMAYQETLHATPKTAPIITTNEGGSLPEVSAAHYELTEEFARGGLGRVLRAKDKRLGRDVAIKELLHQGRARERFLQEALITARLQHPAIVPIYEAGVWSTGEPFYSMKFVSGKPLSQLISETKELSARVLLLPKLIAVCEAVAYAHSQQIIHRDLKPHNILLGEFGETILIDWGLAKDLSLKAESVANPDAPQTNNGLFTLDGTVLGTPGYMPPEQARGEPADERADVYSLGAILYHMLAGESPSHNKNVHEAIQETLDNQITPLEEKQPETPSELLTIVKRAMAHHPSERYSSVKEFLEELQRFQRGQRLRSHEYSLGQLLRLWVRRNRMAFVVAGVASLLLCALVGFYIYDALESNRKLQRQVQLVEETAAHLSQEQSVSNATNRKLFYERGVKELRDGSPLRASLSFLAALRLGSSVGLRALLSQSMRPLNALQDTRKTNVPELFALVAAPNGDVVLHEPERLTVWRGHEILSTIDGNFQFTRLLSFIDGGSALIYQEDRQSVNVWSIKEQRLRRTFRRGTEFVTAVALSSDQSRLFMGYGSGLNELYDVKTGEVVLTFSVKGGLALSDALFTPDGEQLLTERGHFFVRDKDLLTPASLVLWDLKTGDELKSAPMPDIRGAELKLSPDGELLALHRDDLLSLWSLSRLEPLWTTSIKYSNLSSVDFSLDGRLFAAAMKNGVVKIWEKGTIDPKFFLNAHHGEITSLRFIPGEDTLATAGTDRLIKLWDLTSGTSFASLEGHERRIVSLAASSGKLISADISGLINTWNPSIRPWSRTIQCSLSGLNFVVFLGELVLAGGRQTSIDVPTELWSTKTGERVASFTGETGIIMSISASPDASQFVVTKSSSEVDVYSAKGEKRFSLIGHTGSVDHAAFSPDGTKIVTSARDKTARLWSAEDGRALAVLRVESRFVRAAIFSPDGSQVATAESDGSVYLWDATTGARGALVCKQDDAYQLSFSSDGRHLLVLYGYGAVVYDLKKNAEVIGFEGSLAKFFPGGERVLVGTRSGVLQSWSLKEKKSIKSVVAHKDTFQDIGFSPDGTMFYSVSTDKSAILWDAASLEEMLTFGGHMNAVNAVAFAPDGRSIATVGEEGTIKLWSVTTEDRPSDALQKILSARLKMVSPQSNE